MRFLSPISLVEGSTRNYVNYMLIRSHKVRVRYYNFFFNAFLFGLFVFVVGGSLVYKWRTKESSEEKSLRRLMKRNYVLERLGAYNKTAKSIDGAYNTPLSANSHLVREMTVMPSELLTEETAHTAKVTREMRSNDITHGGAVAPSIIEKAPSSVYATPWSYMTATMPTEFAANSAKNTIETILR